MHIYRTNKIHQRLLSSFCRIKSTLSDNRDRTPRTWERLARISHPSVFVAKVDCAASASNDLCRSYDVTVHPTLRYYLDRTEHEYDGRRSLGALARFVETKLATPCEYPFHSSSSSSTTSEEEEEEAGRRRRSASSCSEGARGYADKWDGRDDAELAVEVDRLTRMMGAAELDDGKAGSLRWMRERRDILGRILLRRRRGGEEL